MSIPKINLKCLYPNFKFIYPNLKCLYPNLKCVYPKFDIAVRIPKFGHCTSIFEMSISKCHCASVSTYRNDFCNIDTVDLSYCWNTTHWMCFEYPVSIPALANKSIKFFGKWLAHNARYKTKYKGLTSEPIKWMLSVTSHCFNIPPHTNACPWRMPQKPVPLVVILESSSWSVKQA